MEMDIDFSAVPESELQFLPEYIEDMTDLGVFGSDDGWKMGDGTIVPRSDTEILISYDYGDVGFFCRLRTCDPQVFLYYYDLDWASGELWLIGLGDGSTDTILSMLSRYCDHYHPAIPTKASSHVREIDTKDKLFSEWKNKGLYAKHRFIKLFEEDVARCKFTWDYNENLK